jgi:hypothetical protein
MYVNNQKYLHYKWIYSIKLELLISSNEPLNGAILNTISLSINQFE